MQVEINGQTKELDPGITIDKLLRQLRLTGPVAVELNKNICPKSQHAHTLLKDKDSLEIVTIVGGG